MTYDVKKLYLGIVDYKNNYNRYIMDVHPLYKEDDSEELYDLYLNEYILPYGEDNRYFSKSLISYTDVLFKSRISWGSVSREDAIKLRHYNYDLYLKLLSYKGIRCVDDLVTEEKEHKLERQKR